MTDEQKTQFNEIFDELSKSLDITKAQYEAAVNSYQFVADWLSASDSPLSKYRPSVSPQGSFLIGTMTRAINENDDLDLDLVCRLEGKDPTATQYDVKKLIGDRLKQHETLKRMLDKEGRRCWTLLYREQARFHMDVLPAITNSTYQKLLEQTILLTDETKLDHLSIRITDKTRVNYEVSILLTEWLKSNPFGYAIWFKVRARTHSSAQLTLKEAIAVVPAYATSKLPLQRVVQIFKRHRDIMFNGDKDKPISIIITTLAAKAYKGEENLLEALINVVNSMEHFIETRYDAQSRKYVKWVSNPVNAEENFADKWQANPAKEANFYKWLTQVKSDLINICNLRGLHNIQESLQSRFGKPAVDSAFSNIGENARRFRESGAMKMAAVTGSLSDFGRTNVTQHTNYGNGK
jgi:hypothetical protein